MTRSRRGSLITAQNFFPKIDGSTVMLAHPLQHRATSNICAMLLGPDSGMREYARVHLFWTLGVPLRVYPGLNIKWVLCLVLFYPLPTNFIIHIIHLVDPIWLGTLRSMRHAARCASIRLR
ncbi:hypothetical protein B0H13DRAFT_2312676 [Mycena leptocephala]|nr:hypothetical protein B0H13DRAFT_2312676 [Mycena leptocephala]